MRNKASLLLVLIAVLSAGVAFYFFNQYQQAQKLINNPTELAKKETKTLTEQVGKLIVLPKDETPTVATVSDKSKLKNQPFFAKAENGDKVLIYIKDKRAILYRPSTNKIINVAPVNIEQPTGQQPTGEPVPTATP